MSNTTITSEERRLLRSGGYGDYERLRLLNALESAEAEVVQLKAERRYLANALSSYGDEDEEMSAEDWERSASRAVAAGEEPCQK